MLALAGCGPGPDPGPVANPQQVRAIRMALTSSSGTSGAASQSTASTGTGWATIRGRFLYDAAPPSMPPYDVTKDQTICAPGGHAPPQQTLLVDDANHGIKNIAVYVRNASRVHESAQPTNDDVLFDQKECEFLSHVMAVTVGQTLDIKNSDPVGHNTKITGKKNTFNQTIPVGETIPYKIQQEEATPAPVNCSIHPWMSAYLLPRENRYVAVTAADGSFEIDNVPAGEALEIQVWHESATGPGGGLVVNSPEAKELNWSSKGRFTVTLEPDQVKEIDVTVPASAFRG